MHPDKETIRTQIIQHLKEIRPQEKTSREIAKFIMDRPENGEYLEKRKREREDLRDPAAMIQQLAAEIQPHILWRQDKHIKRTTDKPFRLRYSDRKQPEPFVPRRSDVLRPRGGNERAGSRRFDGSEQGLYPKVIDWLEKEGFKARRIDEREAEGPQEKGKNHWLFPDIVGIRDANWNLEKAIRGAKQANAPRLGVELWSLEIKKDLNIGNHRRYYFQAVSNSAWANEGYLVAVAFEDQEKVVTELRMLAQLHGIGVAKLDPEEARGEILVPALRKDDMDWHIANRLHKESKTFRKIIASMTRFHHTRGELIIEQ